jgi:hypothetical protein
VVVLDVLESFAALLEHLELAAGSEPVAESDLLIDEI